MTRVRHQTPAAAHLGLAHATITWRITTRGWGDPADGATVDLAWEIDLGRGEAACVLRTATGPRALRRCAVRVVVAGDDMIDVRTEDATLHAVLDPAEGRAIYARTSVLRELGVPGGRAEIRRDPRAA
jgi:hypothetical protein